jgi:hypothetical protein
MLNPRIFWYFLLGCLIFGLATRVFEARDLEKKLRNQIIAFEKAHPVPWSAADHEIREEIRGVRKMLREHAVYSAGNLLLLLLLFFYARGAIGPFQQQQTQKQESAEPIR